MKDGKMTVPEMVDAMKGMHPSDVITAFLDWLAIMKDEHEEHWDIVGQEDKKVQDFLHSIEFSANYDERNKIATKLHISRIQRRKSKDRATVLKPIKTFIDDATNRGFIKRLKKLRDDLKREEEYTDGQRTYTPRVNGASENGVTSV